MTGWAGSRLGSGLMTMQLHSRIFKSPDYRRLEWQ
uniref:Uncharacterized protein n=1 Tax=Arundo donax TaxID=35708 RepID=A0A0A9DJM2_ARUDO